VGFRIVTPAEGFIIDANTGTLSGGEVERSELWGAKLGAAFARR